MSSQSMSKGSHTKILEVFRSKTSKKNAKEPREQLFFKIKPDKAVSELIIPYKDLKDNFPYALIEYYQTKIKVKNQTENNLDKLIAKNQKLTLKTQTISAQQKNQQKNLVNLTLKEESNEKKSKNDDQGGIKVEPILDYDKFILQTDLPLIKYFHVLFSQSEPIENRYLKDLNEDQNNMNARRNSSNFSNYESKRKKLRIDYSE